jgi:hypothetical protein
MKTIENLLAERDRIATQHYSLLKRINDLQDKRENGTISKSDVNSELTEIIILLHDVQKRFTANLIKILKLWGEYPDELETQSVPGSL